MPSGGGHLTTQLIIKRWIVYCVCTSTQWKSYSNISVIISAPPTYISSHPYSTKLEKNTVLWREKAGWGKSMATPGTLDKLLRTLPARLASCLYLVYNLLLFYLSPSYISSRHQCRAGLQWAPKVYIARKVYIIFPPPPFLHPIINFFRLFYILKI